MHFMCYVNILFDNMFLYMLRESLEILTTPSSISHVLASQNCGEGCV